MTGESETDNGLLAEAKRQTDELRNIRIAVLMLLVLAILGALIGLWGLIHS